VLRPRFHSTLEKRSVVDRQIHGEADGRRGKGSQEQPALPVAERAGWQEDDDEKKERAEHSLNNPLPGNRIHERHQASTRLSQRRAQNAETSQLGGSRCLNVTELDQSRCASVRWVTSKDRSERCRRDATSNRRVMNREIPTQ